MSATLPVDLPLDDEWMPAPGEWFTRRAPELEVSFPERTIELVVMPYEEVTLVEHPRRPGVLVEEVCSRGAYDGVEKRPSRVKVNRDHDDKRIVGKALTLHPSHVDGLVGRLHISNTDLGTETLQLAADGVLDGSAGFRPMAGGVRWETRSRCRLTKCFLGHVALVGEGAYAGARVLNVRDLDGVAPTDTRPNLEQVYAWRLRDRYASLL